MIVSKGLFRISLSALSSDFSSSRNNKGRRQFYPKTDPNLRASNGEGSGNSSLWRCLKINYNKDHKFNRRITCSRRIIKPLIKRSKYLAGWYFPGILIPFIRKYCYYCTQRREIPFDGTVRDVRLYSKVIVEDGDVAGFTGCNI